MLCAALQNDMEFLCLFFDFLGARLRSRQKDERYPKGSGNAMDVIIQASVIEGGFPKNDIPMIPDFQGWFGRACMSSRNQNPP